MQWINNSRSNVYGKRQKHQLDHRISTNLRFIERYVLLTVLVILDFGIIHLALWLAYTFRFETNLAWFYQPAVSPLTNYYNLSMALAPFWIFTLWLFGLYEYKKLFTGVSEYTKTFNAITFGMLITILYIFFVEETIARGWVVSLWFFLSILLILGRFSFRRLVHYLRSRNHFLTAVLIVGADEEGKAIAKQLCANRREGISVVAFVDDQTTPGIEPIPGIPVLGTTRHLDVMVKYLDIHEVIIAATSVTHEKFIELFQTFGTRSDVNVRFSSGLYELFTTGVEVKEVGNVPLMALNKMRLSSFDAFLKRTLDLVVTALALSLLLPVMLLIAIAVALDSSGPVIYKRRVVGVGGKTFDALKFRTMYTNGDELLNRNPELRSQFEKNYKLKEDPRVTRVGKWLRRTSLDELPQLFNVLAGQMSLVGPRMITEAERPRYGKWHLNLFTVKPGITGLWQVSGRSDVSYEERVTMDMSYIRNYSIWADLYILWVTMPAVLKSRGAY